MICRGIRLRSVTIICQYTFQKPRVNIVPGMLEIHIKFINDYIMKIKARLVYSKSIRRFVYSLRTRYMTIWTVTGRKVCANNCQIESVQLVGYNPSKMKFMFFNPCTAVLYLGHIEKRVCVMRCLLTITVHVHVIKYRTNNWTILFTYTNSFIMCTVCLHLL
jgi:hypothetical protein